MKPNPNERGAISGETVLATEYDRTAILHPLYLVESRYSRHLVFPVRVVRRKKRKDKVVLGGDEPSPEFCLNHPEIPMLVQYLVDVLGFFQESKTR